MKATRLSAKVLILLSIFISVNAYALDRPDLQLQYEKKTGKLTGLVNKTVTINNQAKIQLRQFVDPKEKESQAIQASDKFLLEKGSLFGIKNVASELYPSGVTSDNLGSTQVRYEQRYNGVKVYGSDFIAQLNSDNEVLLTKGTFNESVNLDVKPKVLRSNAVRIAKKDLENKTSWNKALRIIKKENRSFCRKKRSNRNSLSKINACVNKAIKLFSKANGLYEAEATTLLIRDNKLVWKVNLTNIQDKGQTYFVDAKKGSVLNKESHEQHVTVRNIFDCGDHFGDVTCWMDTLTFHWGPEFLYGRSEGRPARGPSPASAPITGSTDVDYFYDTAVPDINSFYLAKFGRDGMNTFGGTVSPSTTTPNNVTKVFVNYDYNDPAMCSVPTGASGSSSVTFCKGATRADAIGHEFAHIVAKNMQVFPNFTRLSLVNERESGALNESHSDIMGQSFELFETGQADWQQGSGSAIFRNLANPQLLTYFPAGAPGGVPFPDNYNSPNFYCTNDEILNKSNDFGGVHRNSTVPSKAAYLASEGGSFNGCQIQGIGLAKVEQIWYRALTTYFTTNETFNMAYNSLNQACQDFVPNPNALTNLVPPIVISQDDCNQLKAALQAVEMDQDGGCNGNVPANNDVTPTCVVQQYSGDLDFNGSVDLNDYQVLRGRWNYPVHGQALRSAPPAGDANGDGAVNILDYNIVKEDFEAANPGITFPPAPTVVGDLNFDGSLNITDYNLYIQTKGQTGPGLWADADVNGVIDNLDLQMWAYEFPGGIAGDYNHDSVVDLWDFNTIKKDWKKQQAGLAADIDVNNTVDEFDLGVWAEVSGLAVLPANPTLPGDLNGDGYVNGSDFMVWQRSLGQTGPALLTDSNADGLVDGSDLADWKANFGRSLFAPVTAVGDFDGNSTVDLADFDVLKRAVFGLTSSLAADASNDGVVNQADYNLWLTSYNQPNAPIFPNRSGDCDGDGVSDGNDFLSWQRAYGQTGPALSCDFNVDGIIDGADLNLWKTNFGN